MQFNAAYRLMALNLNCHHDYNYTYCFLFFCGFKKYQRMQLNAKFTIERQSIDKRR